MARGSAACPASSKPSKPWAALLYAGAAVVGALIRQSATREARLRRTDLGRLMMLAGVLLHLLERHTHSHQHAAMDHEHAHRQDDGHHLHQHDPMPAGPHSHPQHHEPLNHTHAHVPDAHHQHVHGA